MSEISLVGRFGIARIDLVGGSRDGEKFVAPVGAPIVVKEKVITQEQKGPTVNSLYISLYSFGTSPTDEGEGWKAEAAKKEKKMERWSVYCPRIIDGKATLFAEYVGTVELPA